MDKPPRLTAEEVTQGREYRHPSWTDVDAILADRADDAVQLSAIMAHKALLQQRLKLAEQARDEALASGQLGLTQLQQENDRLSVALDEALENYRTAKALAASAHLCLTKALRDNEQVTAAFDEAMDYLTNRDGYEEIAARIRAKAGLP